MPIQCGSAVSSVSLCLDTECMHAVIDQAELLRLRLASQRIARQPTPEPASPTSCDTCSPRRRRISGRGCGRSGCAPPAPHAHRCWPNSPSGTVVRSWPMRGTLHFVAPEDLRWMLQLTAPRTLASAATRQTAARPRPGHPGPLRGSRAHRAGRRRRCDPHRIPGDTRKRRHHHDRSARLLHHLVPGPDRTHLLGTAAPGRTSDRPARRVGSGGRAGAPERSAATVRARLLPRSRSGHPQGLRLVVEADGGGCEAGARRRPRRTR